MRIHIVGLAAGIFMTATAGSQASAPNPAGNDLLTLPAPTVGLTQAKATPDSVVIARRGRGADDPAGDDNGGRKDGNGKKGGKGRGGKDDGPNHDRNDDHGNHGVNHT